MLLNEIKNKHTIKALSNHKIDEELLNSLTNLKELHLLIRRLSRRKWYNENKQYFKDKYKNEYKEKVLPKMREKMMNKYYLEKLPNKIN